MTDSQDAYDHKHIPKETREYFKRVSNTYPQVVESLMSIKETEVRVLVNAQERLPYRQGRVKMIEDIISIFTS